MSRKIKFDINKLAKTIRVKKYLPVMREKKPKLKVNKAIEAKAAQLVKNKK